MHYRFFQYLFIALTVSVFSFSLIAQSNTNGKVSKSVDELFAKYESVPPFVLDRKKAQELSDFNFTRLLKLKGVKIKGEVKYNFRELRFNKKIKYYSDNDKLHGTVKFETLSGEKHKFFIQMQINSFLVYGHHYECRASVIRAKYYKSRPWKTVNDFIDFFLIEKDNSQE